MKANSLTMVRAPKHTGSIACEQEWRFTLSLKARILRRNQMGQGAGRYILFICAPLTRK